MKIALQTISEINYEYDLATKEIFILCESPWTNDVCVELEDLEEIIKAVKDVETIVESNPELSDEEIVKKIYDLNEVPLNELWR